MIFRLRHISLSFLLYTLLAFGFTTPSSSQTLRCQNALRNGRFVLPIETSDLRRLWEDQTLREKAISFFKKGLFKESPNLGAEFIAKLERLLQMSPILTDDAIYIGLRHFILDNETVFNLAYKKDDDTRIRERVRQLKVMTPNTPATILDIGAGTGQIVSGLATEFGIQPFRAFGVEVAKYMGQSEISWLQYENNGRIPATDRSFDLITILMVLHHVNNPDYVIREAWRVLNHRGAVIIRETHAPDMNSKLFNRCMDTMFYRVFSAGTEVPLPHNYKSSEEWRMLFEKSGFKVNKTTEPDYSNPFTPIYFRLELRE